MPDAYSIPFKQADGNGHYKSKQLPQDQQDFLIQLGVPEVFGDVMTGETATVTGQLTTWYGTDGHVIKAVPITTSGVVVLQNGVATFEAHPAGALVGTDAVQTLTNKTFGSGIVFGAGTTFTGGVIGLTKTDVGLGNVDNTSDAQKNAAVATLTNKTISTPTINSPTFSGTVTGLTKQNVGLGNVDNTSDLNKPLSTADVAALAAKQDISAYNVANGYAPLGADSKVPLANLPDAVLGASKYQGTWNATTNIPPIPPAAPSNAGWYYVVATAGNTSVDGINVWAVGDWIISNGTYWQKIPNTNAVISVNAKTGAVVLTKADIGLSNVDNTSDATKNSAAATLTNKIINGASNSLVVRLDADVTNNLPVSRLNGGTGASAATFWRGDGLWVSPTGAGDVVGPSTSVDGEVTLFSGTTGKLLRTFGGAAGFAKVGSGAALTTVPSIGALDVNASLVHGQVQKTSTVPLDEFLLWDSAASALKSVRAVSVVKMPRSYLAGCGMANNGPDATNGIDIAPGTCRDSTDAVDIVLASTLTKKVNAAWAAGNNLGGLDTGTVANTSYHVFVIYNSTSGVVDALFSASATAPTMPSGYGYFRRVGSIIRFSNSIVSFSQTGDVFTRTEVSDYSATSARTFSLLTISVPIGVVIRPIVCLQMVNATQGDILMYLGHGVSPVLQQTVLRAYGANAYNTSINSNYSSNTSAQISFGVGIGAGSLSVASLTTQGWFDGRGKDV